MFPYRLTNDMFHVYSFVYAFHFLSCDLFQIMSMLLIYNHASLFDW